MRRRQQGPRIGRLGDQQAGRVVGIDAIVPVRQTCSMVSLSRQSLWRLSREDRFPRPVRITASRIGWRLSEVQKWIRDREQV